MKRICITIIVLLFATSLFFAENRRIYLAKEFIKKAQKYLQEDAFYRSRRYFERAYRKSIIINYFTGLFHALKGLGDVNMKQGYIDRAFDMYNRARYFAYKAGETMTLMYVDLCRNVARVHAQHKYYKNAVSYMKVAVAIGGRIGDPMYRSDLSYLHLLQALRKKHGDIGH